MLLLLCSQHCAYDSPRWEIWAAHRGEIANDFLDFQMMLKRGGPQVNVYHPSSPEGLVSASLNGPSRPSKKKQNKVLLESKQFNNLII